MLSEKEVNIMSEFRQILDASLYKSIDGEYTKYKEKCLAELDSVLELKRNEVVKNVMDSLDIAYSRSAMDINPTIEIQIIKKKN